MRQILTATALSAALILGVTTTAAAATPKQTIKAQRATIAKLKTQLAKVKADDAATITGLKGQIATLTTANTTLTSQASTTAILNSGKDATITSLQTTNAALVAQVSAQAAGGLSATLAGSPTDLWNAIAAIYPLLPNSPDLCGFSKTAFFGSVLTSYSFDRWAC